MLPKRTLHVALLLVVAIATIAFGLARPAPAASQADVEAKIENAMSAAPSPVSAQATILDNEFDDAGAFVVLRDGTNGWYCFPDIPASPVNDPQCIDQAWLDWTDAFFAGDEPNVTVPGLA